MIKGAKRRLDAQVVRECAYGRGLPMNRLDLMPKKEASIDYGGTNPPNEPSYPSRPVTAGALANAMGNRADFTDSFFTSLRKGAPAVKSIPVRGKSAVGVPLMNPAAQTTSVIAASQNTFNPIFPTGSSRLELDENWVDAVESELGITLPTPVPDAVYSVPELELGDFVDEIQMDAELEASFGLPDPSQPVIDESEILRQPYQEIPQGIPYARQTSRRGVMGNIYALGDAEEELEMYSGEQFFKQLTEEYGLSKSKATKIMREHRGGTPIRRDRIKKEMDKMKERHSTEISRLLREGKSREEAETEAKSLVKSGKDEYAKMKRAEKESRAGSSRDIPESVRVKPTPADIESARSSLETFRPKY